MAHEQSKQETLCRCDTRSYRAPGLGLLQQRIERIAMLYRLLYFQMENPCMEIENCPRTGTPWTKNVSGLLPILQTDTNDPYKS